ncbi:MAG TPA: Asp-tRNA(Asn)/Glu-tRNA(Gln) amidotransferase GatCAB subunit B, partial [bacterium]|nr:Asp-tRNA(Asn)/Glu-tRNA(Gln) amidotransferase GatCAB subunit B [bacterium]
EVIAAKGMEQISDEGALAAAIDQVLDNDPALVQQYLAGKETLLGAFVGKTMKATGGKANPTLLPGLIKVRLEARRGPAE